jgi:putative endonuclease
MSLLGAKGENIASDYLRKKGYLIVHRNYKTPFGEMDIIAKDGGTIVFVEVKTRTSDSFGAPEEAVHAKKREKIRKIALHYLSRAKVEAPSRFDVISIMLNDGRKEIEHIVDAFEV